MNIDFVLLPELTTAMAYGSLKGPTLEELKASYCKHNQIDQLHYYFMTMSITKNKMTETLYVLYAIMEPQHTLPKDFQKVVIKPSEYVRVELPKENYQELMQSSKNELDAYVKSHGKGITMTNILYLFEEVGDKIIAYFPVK